MITTAGTQAWQLVRCKWCGKPQCSVQGATVVRFRCSDRGCRMQNEVAVVD